MKRYSNASVIDSLSYIPCLRTTHKSSILQMLRELVEEDDDMLSTCATLLLYPVQRFASRKREKVGIDLETIYEIMSYQETKDYFGINEPYYLNNQRSTLECTDKLVKLIDSIFKNNDFKALIVHKGMSTPVSRFLLTNYYKDEIKYVHEHYGAQIKELLDEIHSNISVLEDDISFIYHDTDIFMRVITKMNDEKVKQSSKKDYSEFVDTTKQCINELKTYPTYGSIYTKILLGRIDHKTDTELTKELGRSSQFMISRKNEALSIISCILWGYAIEEVLNFSLKSNQKLTPFHCKY